MLNLLNVVQESVIVEYACQPGKMCFRVKVGKLLGFYLIKRGIEADTDKCEKVIQMSSSTSKKEVQMLNIMLTYLNRFISNSAHYALPFFIVY